MRRLPVTAALLAATLTAVALPVAASADPYDRGNYGWHGDRDWHRDRDWRRDDWRAREWQQREWRAHHRHGGYAYRGYATGYGDDGYARPYVYARPRVVYGDPYRY